MKLQSTILNLMKIAAISILLQFTPSILPINLMSNAGAVGHYQNSELADYALRFVNQWGGNACHGTGKSANGQCKTFVNCIVYAVSGRTQWPAPGYNSGFKAAGGQEVGRNNTVRGDIIQVGDGGGGQLHTAIILWRHADGAFEVVDSNWEWNERVKQHKYTPPANARFWRMGQTEKPIIGHLDSVRRAPGGILAQGWSIDQDTASPNDVHLYSGNGELNASNPGASTYANLYRSDIGNVYPSYGPHHGYRAVVRAKQAGTERVCAYGINVPGTPGSYARLGCKDIHVSPDPYGSVDEVKRVPGGVQVRGWTIDPDTASSIDIHVYGGTGAPSVSTNPMIVSTANLERPDLPAHYPDYGAKHGFNAVLPLSATSQKVCVYAINNSPNSHNPQIGCKTV